PRLLVKSASTGTRSHADSSHRKTRRFPLSRGSGDESWSRPIGYSSSPRHTTCNHDCSKEFGRSARDLGGSGGGLFAFIIHHSEDHLVSMRHNVWSGCRCHGQRSPPLRTSQGCGMEAPQSLGRFVRHSSRSLSLETRTNTTQLLSDANVARR